MSVVSWNQINFASFFWKLYLTFVHIFFLFVVIFFLLSWLLLDLFFMPPQTNLRKQKQKYQKIKIKQQKTAKKKQQATSNSKRSRRRSRRTSAATTKFTRRAGEEAAWRPSHAPAAAPLRSKRYVCILICDLCAKFVQNSLYTHLFAFQRHRDMCDSVCVCASVCECSLGFFSVSAVRLLRVIISSIIIISDAGDVSRCVWLIDACLCSTQCVCVCVSWHNYICVGRLAHTDWPASNKISFRKNLIEKFQR